MNNLRNEVRCINTAKETLRNTFNIHGLKAIDYIKIPQLGYEGELVKLSLNIFAYILKESDPKKAEKKLKEYCYSPDFDFKDLLR